MTDDVNIFTIYKVLFPNNKIYIGYTSLPLAKRIKKHYEAAKHEKQKRTPIMNAIRKFQGQESWLVLEQVTSLELAHQREIHYIKTYDATNFNKGYNLSLGGDGIKHTAFTKAKIGKSSTKSNKMRFANPKNVKKQSDALKKYWSKNDAKLEASKRRGGKPFEVINQITGKKVGEFFSQRECARTLGISPGAINNCLQGRRTSCYGYIFKFIGE